MKTLTAGVFAVLLVVTALDKAEGKLAHAKHAHGKMAKAKLEHAKPAGGKEEDKTYPIKYLSPEFEKCFIDKGYSTDLIINYYSVKAVPDDPRLENCVVYCNYEKFTVANGKFDKDDLINKAIQEGLNETTAIKDVDHCSSILAAVPAGDLCDWGPPLKTCFEFLISKINAEGKLAHAKHAHGKMAKAKLEHAIPAEGRDEDKTYSILTGLEFEKCFIDKGYSTDLIIDTFYINAVPDDPRLENCVTYCNVEQFTVANGKFDKDDLVNRFILGGFNETTAIKDVDYCSSILAAVPAGDLCDWGPPLLACMQYILS